MFKFSLRELFLLIVIIAVLAAWWVDHSTCIKANKTWMKTAFELERKNQELLTRLRDYEWSKSN